MVIAFVVNLYMAVLMNKPKKKIMIFLTKQMNYYMKIMKAIMQTLKWGKILAVFIGLPHIRLYLFLFIHVFRLGSFSGIPLHTSFVSFIIFFLFLFLLRRNAIKPIPTNTIIISTHIFYLLTSNLLRFYS